ncbi:nucleotidyltransferase domain-containing protein [bacterium]|nr:nucleotidyltransferase domain-containing protein [bacterium]
MLQIELPLDEIAALCRKWRIIELAVFGSAIRDDFRPDSDVDFLVTFEDGAPWSLWDFVIIIDELKIITRRDVDFVEKGAIKNPFRRKSILSDYEVIFDAIENRARAC